ncbi:MAG: NAD(P)H-binding protein [Polyangiaceae bacterium]
MDDYRAIVLGATGNVGGRIVRLLMDSAACAHVIVVTRRNTGAFASSKVTEVVVDMEKLEPELEQMWPAHVSGVDVALAAFGVGKGSAKMPDDEVRKVEVRYPEAFCRAAKARGARVCGLMTAAGADVGARMKYLRIIGEKERAAEALGFDFLGLYRPGVILGNSNTPGILGYAMPLVHWAMPAKYHSIHKNDLARAMVAQSEEALSALRGERAPERVKTLEYGEMKRFFVPGEDKEP